MKLSMIWAMTDDGLIGRDNDLPWRLPREMRHFMTTTRGHPVIMGRRTFESMDRKPLPKRTNIVVTTTRDYPAPGALVAGDLDQALTLARRQCGQDGSQEAFIIGGAGLYAAAWPLADRLYVTKVHATLEGDTYFPEVDWSPWRELERHDYPADAEHAYPFTISVFDRA